MYQVELLMGANGKIDKATLIKAREDHDPFTLEFIIEKAEDGWFGEGDVLARLLAKVRNQIEIDKIGV